MMDALIQYFTVSNILDKPPSFLFPLLFTLSVIMFLGSLLAVPWLIVRIPADYFLRPHYYIDRWKPRHPVLRMIFLATKNLLGAVFVLAGMAMLVGPGQGILTIVVGLVLLDLPGKRTMELRLLRLRPVIGAINWLRRKAKRPPLELPQDDKNNLDPSL